MPEFSNFISEFVAFRFLALRLSLTLLLFSLGGTGLDFWLKWNENLTFIEHLFCAKPCVIMLWGRCYHCPHFLDEDIEEQGGSIMCCVVAEPGFIHMQVVWCQHLFIVNPVLLDFFRVGERELEKAEGRERDTGKAAFLLCEFLKVPYS